VEAGRTNTVGVVVAFVAFAVGAAFAVVAAEID